MIRLEIAYRPAVPPTDSRIREVLRRQIGARYSTHGVDAAIMELYQNGFVEDIWFEPMPEPGGLVLKVVVVPRKLIWGNRR